MSWPVGLSCRAYRILMGAFPRRFRDRFGPEIAATFDGLAAEAWEGSGIRGLGRLWIKTLADLGRNGGGERMGNRKLTAPPPRLGHRHSPGRRAGVLDTVAQDLSFALRTLRRGPAFAAAVIATMALGIGANTAIFTVVDGILLQALPFEDSERVVILCETHEQVGDYCIASPPNVEDWGRASTTIETFGLARSWIFSMQEPDGARTLGAAVATPGWFDVHGLTPTSGRLFAPQDMEPGNNQVVVLSAGFWQTRFAADEHIVGSTMVLDGNPFTIIGVLPADAWIHNFAGAQIWLPLTAIQDDVTMRSWRGFVALGKLADDTTLAGARDEMEAIRTALATEYPETNQGWGLRIERLRDNVAGSARTTLLIFLGAVGLVLLIACANVANLLLVRATARAQEFAVRASMGAGRLRLVRQLLTESVVLAALGGIGGVLLAMGTTRAFLALAPANIPRLDEVGVDGGVLAFALLLTATTTLLFGLAPAISVARAELGETMKAKRSVDVRGHGTRNLLVIAELALAVMLLVGAGLLTRGFGSLLSWDPGFDRDGLITMFGIAPTDKRETGEQAVDFFERAAAELRALPDVEAVGLTSAGPLFGGIESEGFDIVGRPAASPEDRPSARYYDIGTEYFDTMGIAIVRGRDLEPTDTVNSVPVIVVNETFARRHFADEEMLGRRIEAFNRTWEIVGVARDVRPFAPDEVVGAEIYMPKRQYQRSGGFFVLRVRGDPTAIVEAARARLWAFDRGFDPGRFRTLEEITDRQLVSPRFNMLLIGLFAGVALALAAIGTYGVIAFAVASRTHEIGIRLALGARPEVIRAAVIRRGMALAATGLLLGIIGAMLMSRLLGSLLHGISPTDPLTLAAVVGVFALVSLAACWAPARRASKLDPQVALRAE
jgi:predicted permease